MARDGWGGGKWRLRRNYDRSANNEWDSRAPRRMSAGHRHEQSVKSEWKKERVSVNQREGEGRGPRTSNCQTSTLDFCDCLMMPDSSTPGVIYVGSHVTSRRGWLERFGQFTQMSMYFSILCSNFLHGWGSKTLLAATKVIGMARQ